MCVCILMNKLVKLRERGEMDIDYVKKTRNNEGTIHIKNSKDRKE